MAKTPRRRLAVRPPAGPAAAQAAATAHAPGAGGDEQRPVAPRSTSMSTPSHRPAQRRRFNPFGWLGRLQPRFVADVIAELRKVTWPTFGETRYLTFVVIVVAVVVGIILGAFDLAFGWIIEQLFFN